MKRQVTQYNPSPSPRQYVHKTYYSGESFYAYCMCNDLDICGYCAISIIEIKNFSLDHRIPKSKGGYRSKINSIPCCKKCNSEKGSDTWEVKFYVWNGNQYVKLI